MKRFSHSRDSFSLVEVTLALGVASVCLFALFGLLSVGVQTNQYAISETTAANILTSVVADLRATPKTTATSPQFGITFGASNTLFFDGNGKPVGIVDARYRLTIIFPVNPAGANAATFGALKLTWPAPVDPATASPAGAVETFGAFDRQ